MIPQTIECCKYTTMPDYKFTFSKTTDLYVEAQTEQEAWVQAMTINADVIPLEWTIKLNESFAVEVPLDQGPVEIDDWGPEDDDRM